MSEQNQDGFFRQKIWPSMREFIAGSFAGVGLILAGHPFDTIKVRLQTEGGFGRFKGPVDCLLTTLKEERVFGLYKGAMGPMIGQGAVSASQFSIFTTILPHVSSWELDSKIPIFGSLPSISSSYDRGTLFDTWLSGLLTGTVMFALVTPMEGMKARLQVQYSEAYTGKKAKYSGTVDCYRTVWKEQGLKGYFKGAVPTVFTRLGFSFYMWGYEITRRYFSSASESGKREVLPIQTLVAGAAAGTVFWFSIYPFDVIKNKMMVAPDVNPPVYKGMIDCARQIYAREGWKGFTRGLSVCLIRSVPANATTFLFLEIARWALPK